MSTQRVVEISAELNAALAEPVALPPAPAVPIPEPGIITDMPIADYLALPLMSASGIERLRKSPLQYRHSLTEPPKRTAVMDRGTALHLAVLEPTVFEAHYVVLGQCEGITGRKDRCRYAASVYRAGKHYCGTHDPRRGEPVTDDVDILPVADYNAVLGMRDAIMAHPRARSLFEGRGDFEVTCVFDDPETGVRMKARPDRLIERARMLVDLKTARNASPAGFPRDAENLGYWRKLATYRRALRALGWPYESTAVLAIEAEPPYDLTPFLADEAGLDSADAELSRLLRLYVQCTESGIWSGYSDDFAILQRPGWTQNGE